MNRGFETYFSGGIKASVKTMYKNKGILLVWLYTILSIIGRMTIVLAPLFALADVRQAKLVHAENRAHVAQHFHVACRANSLWTYYGAIFLEILIWLAGLLLMGIATGLLAVIGLLVSSTTPDFPPEYMVIIFCAPGAIAVLVYSVIFIILCAPTAYIVESNPGISAAATVSAAFKSMKQCGKWTCVLCAAIPTLIILAIFGLCVGSMVLADSQLYLTEERNIVTGVLLIVTILITMATYPIFDITKKVALKSLFEDICLDPVNASKHTSGVNIQKCKGVLFEPETIEENMSVLFDETEEDSIPLPASGARTKHNKAARAGAKKVDLSEGEEYNETFDRQEQS